jgi:hypothetical protein
MSRETLQAVFLIAGLCVAVALFGAGIYTAITGRIVQASQEKITVFWVFSISSGSGSLGFIFSGIALFTLCLLFLARSLPR